MIQLISNINSGGVIKNYGTLGTLFNEQFAASSLTPEWTEVGSVATYVGSGTVFTVDRTGSGLDEYILQNQNTSNLEKYTLTCRYSVPTIDTSSYGVAIGQQGTLIAKSHIAGIRTETANLGKIYIYEDNDFSTPIFTSTSTLTINADDILEIEINYDTDSFTVTARNITLATEISETLSPVGLIGSTYFERNSRAGQYALYVVGGESELRWFKCVSNETKFPDYCVVGDSIFTRYAATTLGNSVQGRLETALGGEWVTFAGGGNRTTQILNSINQIIRIKPDRVLLFISTNDFAVGGRSLGDVQTDYSSIVTQLENAGILVILCENIPRTGENFDTWNDWLASNFSNKLIRWHDVMGNPVGSNTINVAYYEDTVHPNDDGFEQMYNIALTSLS